MTFMVACCLLHFVLQPFGFANCMQIVLHSFASTSFDFGQHFDVQGQFDFRIHVMRTICNVAHVGSLPLPNNSVYS